MRGIIKTSALGNRLHGVLDPEGHCVQLYYYMEQIGWDGLPRPAHLRRADWPESLEPQSDTFTDTPFQGPLD